jgi:pyrroline-5-carboxylate reductase
MNFVVRKREQGFFASQKNSDVCERDNDAIIISVKPQQVIDVCKDILAVKGDSLIISVAAGVTLQTLETHLPGRRIVRVMPNTACLVGESASGYTLGKLATTSDKSIVDRIFGSVGLAIELKEEMLNAVTGLSGSGPAYVFQFIEALADGSFMSLTTYWPPPDIPPLTCCTPLLSWSTLGGVRVGLTRHDALRLAAQTVKGAAEMVLTTGSSPAVLKDQGMRASTSALFVALSFSHNTSDRNVRYGVFQCALQEELRLLVLTSSRKGKHYFQERFHCSVLSEWI